MKVKIIGRGAWGEAVYSVVMTNEANVSFAARGEAITDCDVVILCVPTQAIRECLSHVSFSGETKIIINTTKGIEKDTHLLPFEVVESVLGVGVGIDYYSLVGPSFAHEVIKKMPTLVNLGYRKESEPAPGEIGQNEQVRRLFQTDFFHVRLVSGVKSIEINAAFKNIYAIACGLVSGLGYGMNTRAMFISLAVEEVRKLLSKLDVPVDLQSQVGTIGDLILTCTSDGSRNFRFGTLLPLYKIDECMKEINRTVEGYHSVASLSSFEEKAEMKLPLADMVASLISSNDPGTVKEKFEEFIKHNLN